jgi:hypothetical protein
LTLLTVARVSKPITMSIMCKYANVLSTMNKRHIYDSKGLFLFADDFSGHQSRRTGRAYPSSSSF